MMYRICRATLMAMAIAIAGGAGEAQAGDIEMAIDLIRTLERPGQINLATIWDGNKYVQYLTVLHDAYGYYGASKLEIEPGEW
ncbi:MAG TPA: hypothetical protein VHY79_04225 [Rhizomicrobium sp.]|nr:hypothetical protein [Rhizomicrobium sp.]